MQPINPNDEMQKMLKDVELVEFFIVNKELYDQYNMSAGKLGAQIGHVATLIAVDKHNDQTFKEWLERDQKKILLSGKQKDLEKLIEAGFYYIKDNGLTEIPSGSLTVVGLPPMMRMDAKPFIKRLQLFKG
jgi:PTH2 family peptidyl-tRNA hydrolase